MPPACSILGVAIATVAGAILSQAFAAAPALSIKTKIFAATVTIDDALKSSPGLADDCLAEGRTWTARMRAAAEKEHRDNPAGFAQGQQWQFDRTYAERSAVVERYVSIVRTDETFSGGAHPNTSIDTILWDRQAHKRISIRPFFNETADNGPTLTTLAHLVKLAVAVEKIARRSDDSSAGDAAKVTPEAWLKDDSEIDEAIKPALVKLGPVTLAPSSERAKSSGLTFHFSPYAVGSYAEGPYTVFVPWIAFRQYLSDAGAAIFSGTRPKSDEQQ